jgi:hypothetical protein
MNIEETVPLQVPLLVMINKILARAIAFKFCLQFSLKGLNLWSFKENTESKKGREHCNLGAPIIISCTVLMLRFSLTRIGCNALEEQVKTVQRELPQTRVGYYEIPMTRVKIYSGD